MEWARPRVVRRDVESAVRSHCRDPWKAWRGQNLLALSSPRPYKGLNAIDRNLLLFCASQNLAAVRWLLILGANRKVTDENGTTCLHAACRSGSCQILEVLLEMEELREMRDLRDEAGWSPLHVAAFMGRQDSVSVLVRHGATSQANQKGLLPLELCSDVATRRLLQKANAQAFHPSESIAGIELIQERPVERASKQLHVEASGVKEIRFEPFFVPRAPLIPDENMELELVELCAYLGCQIFEAQPGRALAFLVASGCVRDYPIDLVGFIRSAKLSPLQVGSFLGEDFSLAKILRMEFLNSVCLLDTGIISALRNGLEGIQVPQDLQKMHRLLGSLSEVWWRQQLRAARAERVKREDELSDSVAAAVDAAAEELKGLQLRNVLQSMNSLHQLFFSAVMLHWNLQAPLPSSQKLTMEAWKTLNGTNAPAWLLEQLYASVSRNPMPELALTTWKAPGRDAVRPRVAGWADVQAEGLPAIAGAPGSLIGCIQMTNVISENTSARLNAETPKELWLALHGHLLLIGESSPFAFIHLKRWQTDLEPQKCSFTLRAPETEEDTENDLQLIVLLPDGRFTGLRFQHMAIRVSDKEQLAKWIEALSSLKEPMETGEDVPV